MMKRCTSFIGIILISIICISNVKAQTNLALTATAAHSGGGAGVYGPANYNDNVIPSYGNTPWGWVSTNGWIEYTWTTAQTFDKVKFFKDNRPMSSCTFQYWTGSTYVSFYTYNSTTIEHEVSFTPVTTTKLRFLSVSGSSNPNHREIQVFQSILPGFDIALLSIDTPRVIGIGSNNVDVTIMNKRTDSIYWFDVGYQLDNNTPVIVNNVTPSTALGAGQKYNYSFAVPINITTPGTYTLKAWVNNANDSIPDNNPSNDTLTKTVCTGIQGTKTIGASGDYSTFNDAITALTTCGISGNITLYVQAGTYNERVIIPEIPGASATSRVTFDGYNKSDVTLTYSGTTSSNRATVILDGADYITFKNMTIGNTGTIYAVAVLFKSQADYNIISSCKINVNTSYTGSWTQAIQATNSESSTGGTGNNANYNLIENNEINGGYFGINFFGPSSTSMCLGNKFIGNTLTNQYYYGIYLYYQREYIAQYNDIEIGYRNNNAYGYRSYYCQKGNIDGNIVKPGRYGLYLYYENRNSTSDSTIISNNIIYDFKYSSYQLGIYVYYYTYNVMIYHNIIKVKGTARSYSNTALYFYYPRSPKIKNNILISTNYSLLVALYGHQGVEIDNNDYIYQGAPWNKFYSSYQGYYSNLTAWKTATTNLINPHDANSFDNVDPHFVSSTDYHLKPAYPPLKGARTSVAKDVDGDDRCPYEATIGADETQYPRAKPVAGFTTPLSFSDTMCFGSPILFANNYGENEPVGHWWYLNDSLMTRDLNFIYTFPQPGIDTVHLITESCGGTDTFTKVIVIDTPTLAPIADFLADRNIVESYFPVYLSDLSLNCPANWKWIIQPDSITASGGFRMPTVTWLPQDPSDPWGIPTNDTMQNPVLSFDFPGTYRICLTAMNAKGTNTGCKDDYIMVKARQDMCQYVLPEVERSMFGTVFDDGGEFANYANNQQNNPACELKIDPCASSIALTFWQFDVRTGDYIRIYEGTDNTGRAVWDISNLPNGIGNNMTMGSQYFDTTYVSNTGQMFIEWETNNSTNGPGFAADWLATRGNFLPPVAKFDGPDTVCVNTLVNFQDLSTGDKLNYAWDFDNDGFYDCFGPLCSFIFPFPGVYNSKLKASNCGGDDTYSKMIYVINPLSAPSAGYEADIRKPVAGFDLVTFSDASLPNAINTLGCADSWQWDISPNTFTPISGYPTSRNPVIRFDDTGCYAVTYIAGYQGFYDTISDPCYIYGIRYCQSLITTLNPDIGISRVKIGSIDNSTAIGNEAHTDYSNAHSTYLDISAKYLITIERNSTFNTMNRKVWIDFNIDGDFEDLGELVANETEALTLSWSDSIYIPPTTTEGATRMRIGTSLGSMSNTPCGPNLFGEFEDYRVILRPDATAPDLNLLYDDTIYIEQCSDIYDVTLFADSAEAWDNVNGNLTSQIVDTSNLDYTVAGTYFHRYIATDARNNTGTIDRILIVTPDTIPPVITLLGNIVDSIDVFMTYTDPGDTSYDTCSGIDVVTMSGSVDKTHVGVYTLRYMAYDNSGNFVTASRTVYVVDRIDPTIILLGLDTLYIEVHDTFIDQWVTISDNYWQLDPQVNVMITGSVDNHILGDYTLTYSVTDSSGNGPITIQRVVRIIDVRSPSVVSATYNGEIVGDGDTLTVEVHDVFSIPDLNITDNYYTTFDIDTTGNYYTNFPDGKSASLGLYNVIYTITDGSSNSTIIEFIIKVVDTENPVITIIGDVFINLCRFQKLDEDSAIVTDNYDNNLIVYRTGSTYYDEYLIHNKSGYYTINYTATDNSGNKAEEKQRNIYIDECEWYSVNEGGLEEYVSLYPNPNNGQFILNIGLSKAQTINVTIHNALGDIIESINIGKTLGGTFNIDLGDVCNGIYLVKIQTESESTVRRITVTK